MNDFVELMTKPFLACLILVGIHAYLGLHVVKRGVIFVDLALAQVAAFGATLGFLFGFGLHSTAGYLISLTMTLVAAALFAALRNDEGPVPQEAYIGITYAVAAAASIIVLNFAPDGGEELKAVLVGHLLFVEWSEVFKIAAIYSFIGLIHWFARRPFLLISEDLETAKAAGYRVKLWDFLFYATFGFVVTSSVEIAGVLLVFSLLIVPAVCGALLASSTAGRLAVGWTAGFVTSCVGIVASYLLDLPTGATVVCTFALCLLCCGVLTKRKIAAQ